MVNLSISVFLIGNVVPEILAEVDVIGLFNFLIISKQKLFFGILIPSVS